MKAKQVVLTALGFLFTALGICGIVLPILPTTPFLLLAAGCFSISSEKVHRALLGSRILGPYLENYRTGRGITMARKVFAIAFLWVGLGMSMAVIRTLPICLILSAIGGCVTIHLLKIKTMPKAIDASLGSIANHPPETDT